MKRFTAVLISVMLLLGICNAESPFSFGNGITMGMTYEQSVSAIGREPDDFNNLNNGYARADYSGVQLSRYTANLVFCFNDLKLASAVYCVPKPENSDYKYLLGVMKSVYGEAELCDTYEAFDAVIHECFPNLESQKFLSAYKWEKVGTDVYAIAYGYRDSDSLKYILILYAAHEACEYDITGF